MKCKIAIFLAGLLAAFLALVLFMHQPAIPDDAPIRTYPEEMAFSPGMLLVERPVVVAAKWFAAGSQDAVLSADTAQIPFDQDNWQIAVRKRMLEKIAVQHGQEMTEYFSQTGVSSYAGSRAMKRVVKHDPGTKDAAENETGAGQEEAPFELWRELQVKNDNSLAVNMMLVNKRKEGQSSGVIVRQIIPEGWTLSSAWPDVQACDDAGREIKWLFADAASQSNWILQVILIPVEQAEMPLFPESNTSLRCCLHDGSLKEYACLSLP